MVRFWTAPSGTEPMAEFGTVWKENSVVCELGWEPARVAGSDPVSNFESAAEKTKASGQWWYCERHQ